MTAIGALAELGRSTALDDRRATSDAVRHLITDTLACISIGSSHPTTRRLVSAQAGPLGAHGPYRAMASEVGQMSLAAAVTLDCVAAHVDELDSVHPSSGTVPAAVVVPVSLHVAAAVGGDLDAARRAVAAGYEVIVAAALRFGGSRMYQRSWLPGVVAGRLGAAMATSILLDLDGPMTEAALALAMTGAGGLLSNDIFADGHYVQLGDSAAAGVDAAVRAAHGLRASSTLFDGPASAAFGSSNGTPFGDAAAVASAMYKRYPCATPLQAVIRAFDRLGVRDVSEVSEVKVAVPSAVLPYLSADRIVDGPPEAAASVAYALAAVICGRERDVTFFREARADLLPPVNVRLGAGGSLSGEVEVELHTKSGTEVLRESFQTATDPDLLIQEKLPRVVELKEQIESATDDDSPVSPSRVIEIVSSWAPGPTNVLEVPKW